MEEGTIERAELWVFTVFQRQHHMCVYLLLSDAPETPLRTCILPSTDV